MNIICHFERAHVKWAKLVIYVNFFHLTSRIKNKKKSKKERAFLSPFLSFFLSFAFSFSFLSRFLFFSLSFSRSETRSDQVLSDPWVWTRGAWEEGLGKTMGKCCSRACRLPCWWLSENGSYIQLAGSVCTYRMSTTTAVMENNLHRCVLNVDVQNKIPKNLSRVHRAYTTMTWLLIMRLNFKTVTRPSSSKRSEGWKNAFIAHSRYSF